MHTWQDTRKIAQCFELAILLEASSHKPGNVSIVTNFEHTRFEHFLASAVAVTPILERAASEGTRIAEGQIPAEEAGVGGLVKDCVSEVSKWQHGGNTLLGTIILLCPMAVAAGMTLVEKRSFKPYSLRRNLNSIVRSTTPDDAVAVYEAIELANPGGLGKVREFDVTDSSSKNRIIDEKVSLYQVFIMAEKYDTICAEWVGGFRMTFETAYPSLSKGLASSIDIDQAIIQAFLKVLSECPDTFIARKVGFEKAKHVSERSKSILESTLPGSIERRHALDGFDKELRKSGNLLNPGTTADIIAAALALCVLGGYRP